MGFGWIKGRRYSGDIQPPYICECGPHSPVKDPFKIYLGDSLEDYDDQTKSSPTR